MRSNIVHLDVGRSSGPAGVAEAGMRSGDTYAQAVTVEQLRVLGTVAEKGSFTAAARALRKTQSNVSYHVACLEAQLGVTLFDRSGRKPHLTPQGEMVVAHAEQVLARLDHLRAVTFSLKGCPEPRVSIAMDDRFPSSRLSEVFARFRARFPSVSLCVERAPVAVNGTTRPLEAAHLAVMADVGSDHGLVASPSITIDLIPVVAPSHPLAGCVASDDDLAHHAEIALHGAPLNDSPQAAPWHVASERLRLDFLREGIGWAHMPRHLVDGDLARGTLVPMRTNRWGDRPIRIDLYVARRRDRPVGPAVQWLFEALARCA